MRAVRTVLLAIALAALAGCHVDRSCRSDADCTAPGEFCRRGVDRCGSSSIAVTLGAGNCRSSHDRCATADDCIETETCASDGVCRSAPACSEPPSANCSKLGCEWGSPFPCACVCLVCPGADGGT